MNPPLHTGVQRTVEAVDFLGRISSEESKDRFIGQKGHGDHFLGFPRCYPHRLSAGGKDDHGAIKQRFIDPIRCSIEGETVSFEGKKLLFLHDNAPAHSSRVVVSKLNELRYELASQPPHSPNLAPSDFFLFPNLKKSLAGMRFASNEEVIAAIDGYFADHEASYFSDDLKRLKHRLKKCIDLRGGYINK